MTLMYLVAAWLVGLLVATRITLSPVAWLALAGTLSAAAIALRSSRRDRIALACLCFFALGAARYSLTQRPLPEEHIVHAIGRGDVTLVGTVDAPPEPRDTHLNLRLKVEQIGPLDAPEPASGFVLVQAPRELAFRYGDRLRIRGALQVPPEYDDFSYRDYLARRGIHALVRTDSVDALSHNGGSAWRRAIFTLRERSLGVINRVLPSPHAPLLAGILLGDESGIPADVREAFNRTGAAHVLAISGSNIAILLRVLMGLLTPLAGRDRALALSSALIFGYAVLVGWDPAVVRAAIMGVLAMIALRTRRRAHGVTSLAFAVWIMSIQSPHVLWDIGFQLSVASTAGLILFTDDFTWLLDRGLRRIFPAETAARLVGWLSEPLIVSIAAQITTTPLLLITFGRLSLASLLANMLIVSIQPYIMIGGWIALAAGLVWLPMGEVLAWSVWLPLAYMLRVVEALARFSWASVDARLSATVVYVLYALLLVYGLGRIMHPDDRRALAQRMWRGLPAQAPVAAEALIALLLAMMVARQPDGKLHVWILDVGEGAGVLIETPRGAQILVDGGRSPTRLQAALGRALPFYDRTLDAVIVTRSDTDAVSALPAVFERYSAETILLAAPVEEGILAEPIAGDAPLAPLRSGHTIMTDDGVQIEVVAPRSGGAAALQVRYGDASFLLSDSLRPQDELALLGSGWYPRSTVLQVPGGGSERANTPRFLAEVRAQVAVAAVAAGDHAGLPHTAVLDWLAQSGQPRVFRTDRDGTVEIVTDGAALEVRTTR